MTTLLTTVAATTTRQVIGTNQTQNVTIDNIVRSVVIAQSYNDEEIQSLALTGSTNETILTLKLNTCIQLKRLGITCTTEMLRSKLSHDEISECGRLLRSYYESRRDLNIEHRKLTRMKKLKSENTRRRDISYADITEQMRKYNAVSSRYDPISTALRNLLSEYIQKITMSEEEYEKRVESIKRRKIEEAEALAKAHEARRIVYSAPVVNYAIDSDHWSFQK